MAQPQMTKAQMQAQAIAANTAARSLVVKNAENMTQSIFSQTITTYTNGTPITLQIPVKNVGLIKRFWVEVQATVSGTASGPTHTLQALGPSTFFSQVVLSDLSNQQRINTAGWHLTQVSSAKRRRVLGSAVTTDTPFGYGNNFTTVVSAPSTITAVAASNNVFAIFEVPCSYTDHDLRGAIYANVTSATMYLNLTVNPTLLIGSGTTDGTFSMYKSSSATIATMPSFTVNVYQNYLDQLPIGQNGVILPQLDLGTAYMLNNTPVSAITANADNPIPYANFRDFMSTTVIYDNAGTLNVGSDINAWKLQTANYTNIFNIDPYLASFLSRLEIQDDCPKGMYYFDHRQKPVNTIQYGNMALILNPSSVTAGASLQIGYEALALINLITQAGSLYGN